MDHRDEYWGNPYLQESIEEQNPTYYYDTTQQYQLTAIHPDSHHRQFEQQHQPQHLGQQQRFDHRLTNNRGVIIAASDVLCGRGKTSFNHEGNKVFRTAVSAALEDFVNAVNRFEKALVVQRVVDSVRSRGGRFLKEDSREGIWYQLSDQQSKEKVGHAIRDAANLYEVRKLKEKQGAALTTPQLKNTGESDDDNATTNTAWWPSSTQEGSSRGRTSLSSAQSRSTAYTPTDFSADYLERTSTSKRRSIDNETKDFQPQRKRRRTASPVNNSSYFEATIALSDNLMSTPLASRRRHQPMIDTTLSNHLRQSPIIQRTANRTLGTGDGTVLSPGGGIISKMPSELKRSPIAPTIFDQGQPTPQQRKREIPEYFHQFTLYPQQQSTSTQSKQQLDHEHVAPLEVQYPPKNESTWDRYREQPQRDWQEPIPPYNNTNNVDPTSAYNYRAYPHQHRPPMSFHGPYPPPNVPLAYPYSHQYYRPSHPLQAPWVSQSSIHSGGGSAVPPTPRTVTYQPQQLHPLTSHTASEQHSRWNEYPISASVSHGDEDEVGRSSGHQHDAKNGV